jgi:hypothetical protein
MIGQLLRGEPGHGLSKVRMHISGTLPIWFLAQRTHSTMLATSDRS